MRAGPRRVRVCGVLMLGVFVIEDCTFYVAPLGAEYTATGPLGPEWVPMDDAVSDLRPQADIEGPR